jgi:hypothetical protein
LGGIACGSGWAEKRTSLTFFARRHGHASECESCYVFALAQGQSDQRTARKIKLTRFGKDLIFKVLKDELQKLHTRDANRTGAFDNAAHVQYVKGLHKLKHLCI